MLNLKLRKMAKSKKKSLSFKGEYYHPIEIWWMKFTKGVRIVVFMTGLFGGFLFYLELKEGIQEKEKLNRVILPDAEIDFAPKESPAPPAPPGREEPERKRKETYEEMIDRLASEVIEYPDDYVYHESHELDYNGNSEAPDLDGTVAYEAIDSTDF